MEMFSETATKKNHPISWKIQLNDVNKPNKQTKTMNEPANEFHKIVHRKSIDPNLKIGKSRMKMAWKQCLRIKNHEN